MSIADFTAEAADGTPQPLSPWQGKILLVANTASRCGFTPQYAGLQTLQQRFGPEHFSVLAFPCNQFGAQEPGTNPQIAEFCALNFKVTFPVFARIEVNGANAHPLFAWLTQTVPGLLGSGRIKWNFTKFLIGRNGLPLARYAPLTKPESLGPAITKALADA